ncbi:MAG: hypothetical protein HPY58_13045 [Firmicutes bacterium]|nr:hypothetical protein [Bacillota bacterium]
MTRRLISILFLALAFFFAIVILGGLTGCNGTLCALKEANDYSPLLGYVSVAQEQEGEVWTGRLRDSRGKEVMLFKFTPSGGEARQEYLLFPRRFFAWAGKHVAYCGAEQQEVVLVDYQTQKEVFRKRLPERVTYLSAHSKGEEFLVATEKALYLVQPAEESSVPRSSEKAPAFTLRRLKDGVFHWPALSPDGRQVASGKKDEKGEGTALVVIDLSSGRAKEMLPPFTNPAAPDVAYRIITSVAWSPDGKRIVVGTTSPADPRIEWLVILEPETGQKQDLLSTTQLYTPPGCFTPDGRHYLFSQGKPDYREFLGEGNQYTGPDVPDPFRAKLVLLELETGRLTHLRNIPPDLNSYWPLCGGEEKIYFLDKDPDRLVSSLRRDAASVSIYRVPLQGGQPERLLGVKGLVSYAVIL